MAKATPAAGPPRPSGRREGRAPRRRGGGAGAEKAGTSPCALVLGEGRWQDRQVVAADWIRASTRPQCDTGDEEVDDYGYLWWLMKRKPEDPEASIVAARGWGSQFILIVPAERLIAVTTGGNSLNGRSFDVLGVLAKYLLPEAPVAAES